MQQLSCLPTAICQRIKPPPATAAADFIGIDEATTHRWLCKGQGKHAMVPVTEWICSHLAQSCVLPVPPFGVVELQSQPGVAYFGSQWQGGALEFLMVKGRISNPWIFESTHAIDLFVHNIDRHSGNYLYLDLAGDIVARVIDFSHALMVMGWPLPNLPLPACNTTTALPGLLSENPTPYQRPDAIIERIAALPSSWMRDTLKDMPSSWLDQAHRDSICAWWEGQSRADRLNAAKSALPCIPQPTVS